MFRILVFVLTTRRAPVNNISWSFRWPWSCKNPIITSHSWQLDIAFLCEERLHVELTKNNSSHSQLFYNLERNVVKWLTFPLPAEWALRALIDVTLSNARRFYSSMGNPFDGKGLTGEQTEKEHTEEDHLNLSSYNVYLLFVSFCRFHENFGLN